MKFNQIYHSIKLNPLIWAIIFSQVFFCTFFPISICADQSEIQEDAYQKDIDFFEEVYSVMQKNYYKDVDRKKFEDFLVMFKDKIYGKQKNGESSDYIRWRSASLLVKRLKNQEDIFSELYPPKPAKEYKETALGKKIDLGIEGELMDRGFLVTHVEPRSDAFQQGLRKNDILLEIDGQGVLDLAEKEIKNLLNPLENSKVQLRYFSFDTKKERTITVLSKEYFKQTVFLIPVAIPGVFCIQIQRFNRKTSDDLLRFLRVIKQQHEIRGVILDLRGNPGGPPLAAREISSFFLPGGEPFAYFQKKNASKVELDVPKIQKKYHYDGPLVILVNKKSGSAAELFSGILQRKGRAVLMGTRTAGQVMLKSMFPLEDKSMLLLVTGRGYHPDGATFSFQGLLPNKLFDIDEIEKVDLLRYAGLYFIYLDKKGLK